MKNIEIFSEKLGEMVSVTDSVSAEDIKVIIEDTNSSLVGWCHGGWNNSNGGGSSW